MSVEATSAVWGWRRVSYAQKVVALRLADFAGADGENAWPSVARLADDTGMTDRGVRRIMHSLIEGGYIERTGTTRRGTFVYRIVLAPPSESTPATPDPGSPDPGSDLTRGHLTLAVPTPDPDDNPPDPGSAEPLVEPSVTTRTVRGEPATFVAFWAEYPRKEARPKAAIAYGRALKVSTADEIAAGLARWNRYWAGKDRQYVKTPTAWLNGHMWNDEPPVGVVNGHQATKEPAWRRARARA